MTEIEQARHALAAKAMAEQQLARVAACPPWRHAAFGGVVAMLVVTPALPLVLRFAMLAVIFCMIALIVQSDRRRLGVFINGYRRGKTRWVTFPMLAVILGLYALSLYYGEDLGHPMISVALAAGGFVIAVLGSMLWQRVFVRELGA